MDGWIIQLSCENIYCFVAKTSRHCIQLICSNVAFIVSFCKTVPIKNVDGFDSLVKILTVLGATFSTSRLKHLNLALIVSF